MHHTCLAPVYNKTVLILIYHLYITLLYTLHLLFYLMIGQLRSQNEVMHFLRTIFRRKNCNQILHTLGLVYKCHFTIQALVHQTDFLRLRKSIRWSYAKTNDPHNLIFIMIMCIHICTIILIEINPKWHH